MENNWISIKDREPEDGQEVFVSVGLSTLRVRWTKNEDPLFNELAWIPKSAVTAWCPVSEASKEK